MRCRCSSPTVGGAAASVKFALTKIQTLPPFGCIGTLLSFFCVGTMSELENVFIFFTKNGQHIFRSEANTPLSPVTPVHKFTFMKHNGCQNESKDSRLKASFASMFLTTCPVLYSQRWQYVCLAMALDATLENVCFPKKQ